MSAGIFTSNQNMKKNTIMLIGYRQLYSLHKNIYSDIKDFYSDITKDVETRFDTSNYELDRLLPKGKNKKVIRSTKDESDGKLMTEFSVLRHKFISRKNV